MRPQGAGGVPYKPLPPDRLYLDRDRMEASGWSARQVARLTPFAVPEAQGPAIDIGTKQGHNFARRARRARTPTCSMR